MEVMRTRSTVTVACHCCRRCHSSSSSSLPSTNRSSSSISLQSVFQMFSILLLATTTIFSSFSSVLAFNLDTRIPIYKFGPRDSYFGYSVAEHIIKNRDSSRQSEPVWVSLSCCVCVWNLKLETVTVPRMSTYHSSVEFIDPCMPAAHFSATCLANHPPPQTNWSLSSSNLWATNYCFRNWFNCLILIRNRSSIPMILNPKISMCLYWPFCAAAYGLGAASVYLQAHTHTHTYSRFCGFHFS